MADNKAYIEKKVIEVADPSMESAHVKYLTRSNPYWSNDPDYVRMFYLSQRNYLNDLLTCEGYLTLNDACKSFGFEGSPEGLVYGWTATDNSGYVDIEIHEVYLLNKKELTYEMAYAIEFKNDDFLLTFK